MATHEREEAEVAITQEQFITADRIKKHVVGMIVDALENFDDIPQDQEQEIAEQIAEDLFDAALIDLNEAETRL